MSRPDAFVWAWRELDERLNRGLDALAVVRGECHPTDQRFWRLAEKSLGLETALEIYEQLDEMVAENNDYAGAWQAMSQAVQTAAQNCDSPGMREGIALAIGYQYEMAWQSA